MTLIALAFAWLGSIAMVATWGAPWWLPAAALGGLAPAAARGWLPVSTRLMLALAAMAATGAWRFEDQDTQPPPGLLAYAGQDVMLGGTIASLPDPGRTVTRYRVNVDHVTAGGRSQPIDGAVLITISQYANYERGTLVELSGALDEAPVLDGFDYRAFLLRQGIAGTMFYPGVEVTGQPPDSLRGTVDKTRLSLEDALQGALPEPESSLAAGITLGLDGGISPELYEAYRESGLAHLIAVSGSNLSILAAVVFFVLVPVAGRNLAIIPAALAITVYLFLAGADAPVLRAWIMAGVLLGGAWMGRQQASLAALGAAVIAMTAASPGSVRDVGFQLSVAATAGIIVFGPWLRVGVHKAARACRIDGLMPPQGEQIAAISLAATLATLPITWMNFRQISVVGPLANVLVEPLFVLAFATSLLTAVIGALWGPAGWLGGLVAYYPLAGCSWIATRLSEPDVASVSLPAIHAGWAFAGYVVLAGAGWAAYRYPAPIVDRTPVRNAALAIQRGVIAAGCGAFAVVVLMNSVLPMRGLGALELAVLDVGQGDALLVTTPGGKHVLVDGGASGLETARELSSQLPHWERNLDMVILTHPEQDHIGGLPAVLDRYGVGMVYESGTTNSTEAFAAYRLAAEDWHRLETGDSFELDGVRFDVLWPDASYDGSSRNNHSIVLRVVYGSTRMLLTGDIEAPVQTILVERGEARTDVLKVPHHGAATSSEAFFDAAEPSLAVISVGADNPFGHPREETLDALEGVALHRTDLDGRVIIRSDGRHIEVRTER